MSDEDPVVDASVSELLALKAAAVVPSNSGGVLQQGPKWRGAWNTPGDS